MEIPSTRFPLTFFAKSLRILHNFVDSPDISPREEFVPILTLQLEYYSHQSFFDFYFYNCDSLVFPSSRPRPRGSFPKTRWYWKLNRIYLRLSIGPSDICVPTHTLFLFHLSICERKIIKTLSRRRIRQQERAYFFRREVCRQARARTWRMINLLFQMHPCVTQYAERERELKSNTCARSARIYIPQISPDIL